MIEFVKTWVSKSEHFANEQDETLVEVISELLLEAANIDGKIDDKEIEESKHAICSFFDISEEQATKIIQKLHDNNCLNKDQIKKYHFFYSKFFFF